MEVLRRARRFLLYLFDRYRQDHCLRSAAALSFTTLLSLVPFLAIVFVVLSAFPMFASIVQTIEDFVFENFVPASGEAIQAHVQHFIDKAKGMTGIGIAFLIVVAIMLMATIESVLNLIWGVEKGRGFLSKLTIYWSILTLGPILLAVSVSLTSYLVSLPAIAEGATTLSSFKTYVLGFMPWMATSVALTLLYVLVPNRQVPVRYGLIGGVIAALLFELAKKSFTVYVANVTAYTTIYGALAVIPLFLIWIYLSWVVVLLGAEISRCLTMFEIESV